MLSTSEISRRDLLLGSGALAVATAAGVASAAEGAGPDGDHAHHHAAPNQALVEAALDCVGKAELCISHCLALFKQGDTSLAECLAQVQQTLPMCETLGKLSAYDSNRLVAFAKLCIDFCDDCERECRKHEDHHSQCRNCAESCARCIEACRKLIG